MTEGVEHKRGEGKQRFKKKRGWGKLGQGGGALKKVGLEPPYEVCIYSLAICSGFTAAGLH